VLTGKVNPSRRLPITFPADLSQMPRPVLPGHGTPYNTPITIRYDEGAEVGYRCFAKKNEKPLFAFGHGLSGAVGSPAPGVGRRPTKRYS
jgi:beta-glucosidase